MATIVLNEATKTAFLLDGGKLVVLPAEEYADAHVPVLRIGAVGMANLVKAYGAAVTGAPVAAFTSVVDHLGVAFTDTSSDTPTSWAWTFGDGATATTQSPSHTYAAAGTYTVVLVASNAAGSSAPVIHEVTAVAP